MNTASRSLLEAVTAAPPALDAAGLLFLSHLHIAVFFLLAAFVVVVCSPWLQRVAAGALVGREQPAATRTGHARKIKLASQPSERLRK